MNPFDEVMVNILENGEEPELNQFGGPTSLLENAPIIGTSPLMPEFLRLALSTTLDVRSYELSLLEEFVCQCIENARNDITLKETVDLLYQGRPLSDDKTERCFNRFLSLAADSSSTPITRATSLDGALRTALGNRRMELRLLTFLFDIRNQDDPIFLARAAKIMGVAYSYWREKELLKSLRVLADVEGVIDEACFELGLAKLIHGLEVEERGKAEEAFTDSKYWFAKSLDHREHRPDAAAYISCLEILISFARGAAYDRLSQLAEMLPEMAFQIQAWHVQQGLPEWLGARYSEVSYWNVLANRLRDLSEHLGEICWYEPAIIVEEYVIACYTASRSILKHTRTGGVEALIRPRLEGTLTRLEGQAHQLKIWLTRNQESEWEADARELCLKIDELINKGESTHPSEAAVVRPSIVALLEQAKIPETAKSEAVEAIVNAMSIHISTLPQSEIGLIENCVEAAQGFVDYRNNPNGRALFDSVLAWSVCFLRNRLEMSRKDDPRVGYLFEEDGNALPVERDLQMDFYHFILSCFAGTQIEATNIGAGRADVHFSYGGERIVTEVKRETDDSSFEALERYYSGQTTDYQNVSVRLGFLLVLDLTECKTEGTPHISTLVKPCTIMRKSETEPRCVVIIKVPGRRLLPSDLTKLAKKPEKSSRIRGERGKMHK